MINRKMILLTILSVLQLSSFSTLSCQTQRRSLQKNISLKEIRMKKIFKTAFSDYFMGRYLQASQRLIRIYISKTEERMNSSFRAKVRKYLALTMYSLYQKTKKSKYKKYTLVIMKSWLRINPDASLNPSIYPPELIESFNLIKYSRIGSIN